MTLLRGMTWDHVRGYGPLIATSAQFQKLHPDVTITWDRRSLKDFGDFPVDQMANQYDIIMIDHPHVGISSDQGVLLPIDQWMNKDFIDDQRKHSVGLSYQSYQWNGQLWALPVDAAAQVAAYRPDLLDDRLVPSKWEQVFNLIENLPSSVKVGVPLCPTDLMCSFISLIANIGGDQCFDKSLGINAEAGTEAVELLQKLLPLVHNKSLDWNPIQMLDHMASTNEIAYIPLSFGYSNYSRAGFRTNLISFTNIPSVDREPHGSILGGVGLAISAFSKHIKEALEYAEFVACGDVQRKLYYTAGGQPGHYSAWMDDNVNRDCHNFFKNTFKTLEYSYLRPRFKEFPMFQEQAGEALHRLMRNGISAKETIMQLNELYVQIKQKFEQGTENRI